MSKRRRDRTVLVTLGFPAVCRVCLQTIRKDSSAWKEVKMYFKNQLTVYSHLDCKGKN